MDNTPPLLPATPAPGPVRPVDPARLVALLQGDRDRTFLQDPAPQPGDGGFRPFDPAALPRAAILPAAPPPVAADLAHSDPVPSDPVPSDPVPSDPVPSDPVPADPVPADPVPADPAPVADSAAEDALPTGREDPPPPAPPRPADADALAVARAEGHAEGLAKGLALGRQEVQDQLAGKFTLLEAALARLGQPRPEDSADLAAALATAVRRLAAERAGQMIDAAPLPFLARVARLAERVAQGVRQVSLRLNPEDLQALSPHLAPHLAASGLPSGAQIQADPQLARGDVEIHAPGIRLADLLMPPDPETRAA